MRQGFEETLTGGTKHTMTSSGGSAESLYPFSFSPFFQKAHNTCSNKCKRLILMAISNLQVLYCRIFFAIDSFYAQLGYILFPLPVPAQPSPSLPTGPLTLNRDWALTHVLFPSYIACKSLIAKGSSNNRRVFKYICARSYFHSRYSDGKDLSSSCE